MKKSVVSKKKVAIFVILVLIIIMVVSLLSSIFWYKANISKVSNIDETISFEISKNDTYISIGDKLKKANLIKNVLAYKIYVKLNKPNGLQAGVYKLNKNMNLESIIKELEKGSSYNPDVIRITFREGLSVMQLAEVIEANTNHKKQELYDILKDKKYIDSLIEKYWFLTNDIKSDKIYYSLEGYLYPNTYEFENKNVDIKKIIETMLNTLETSLKEYKEEIEKSNYTTHQIFTLASMLQSEGNNIADMKKMASVFINRLNRKIKLQSCASAYYGDKKIMGRDDFGNSYLKSNNYNTYVIKALPVGPISSPGMDAITAVLNPDKTEYLYFASDKSKKVYFSKTYEEHSKKVSELKSSGNWYGS